MVVIVLNYELSGERSRADVTSLEAKEQLLIRTRFIAGRISIEDAPRQGRPKFQSTDENVQKITDLIKENLRTTLLDLEQDTGISKTTIGRIVTEDLKLKKTPAKFISRFLTNVQNLCRLATCEDMLERTRTDPEWKDKIITGDETWVYGYDPETKRQSAEWRGQDIAPNDFFLFPKLKAVLKGRYFDTRDDIIEKSLLALKSIPKEAYKNCFDNWEKRWRWYKCSCKLFLSQRTLSKENQRTLSKGEYQFSEILQVTSKQRAHHQQHLPQGIPVEKEGEENWLKCSICHRQGNRRATCSLGIHGRRPARLQNTWNRLVSTPPSFQPTLSHKSAVSTSTASGYDILSKPSIHAASSPVANCSIPPQETHLPSLLHRRRAPARCQHYQRCPLPILYQQRPMSSRIRLPRPFSLLVSKLFLSKINPPNGRYKCYVNFSSSVQRQMESPGEERISSLRVKTQHGWKDRRILAERQMNIFLENDKASEELVIVQLLGIIMKELIKTNNNNGLTYQEWRNLFERIVKLQCISEKDALSMIPSIFKGKALEIYASMCQDVFTLDELHQAMNTFFPVSTSGLMKQFWTEKKLPSQPLMDYYFNKLKLAKILNISSEQTLEALSSNVNAKLRPFLIAANPANLDMWMKIASSLEEGFRHEETSSPFNGPRYRRDFQNIDSKNATPSQDSLPSGARPGREVGDRQETRRKKFYQDFRGQGKLMPAFYPEPYTIISIPSPQTIEIDKPCQPENKHATIVNISKVKLWNPVTEDNEENTEPPFPFQEEEDLEGCLGVEPNKQASTDSPQEGVSVQFVEKLIYLILSGLRTTSSPKESLHSPTTPRAESVVYVIARDIGEPPVPWESTGVDLPVFRTPGVDRCRRLHPPSPRFPTNTQCLHRLAAVGAVLVENSVGSVDNGLALGVDAEGSADGVSWGGMEQFAAGEDAAWMEALGVVGECGLSFGDDILLHRDRQIPDYSFLLLLFVQEEPEESVDGEHFLYQALCLLNAGQSDQNMTGHFHQL
ncbi:hypothetical protein LAZ67_13002673 [Cordylochernes scorpioides]|uniref:Uncharacterized protein n=1 Tax=Cordylochernes scorpioides TaxID=51811 RepID=A0ABY6L779_9ARAC|nr:hypothetical protein LAZ67_13002673 [Cordylochernes scorpioides]